LDRFMTTSPSTAGLASALAPQRTALVVASGDDIDDLIAEVLAGEGWKIRLVADNEQVLSLAKDNPFDLIITGRKTRALEDLELLHKIRRSRPHVRLIILSDEGTPADVISAMRQGAFAYFSAPFEVFGLAAMIREAIAAPCWDDGIEIVSATPAWVTIRARCDHDTANRLVQFLRGIKDPTIPEADKDKIIAAFREILLNAMEHGGNFDPSQHVDISFIHARRAVICRVKDPGQGFCLEELRHAAVNSSPEDVFSHLAVREEIGMRPGGFGILLARKLVDDVIYNQQGNAVILVKYLDPPAAPPA
jgi:DNA-binding NarL/FixJ family response regulator/anti-sigma regulatory factor (Ser/Thr protein kinase)